MTLRVNGKEIQVEDHITLQELLNHLDIPIRPVGLAVAVNEEVVPKSRYGEYVLRDGDRVEIVNLVGGG
ncbi:MAG: sulfur carrier protein ThiS [Aquificaceae bacterium]|nr:sulfur carrier protein ThiS [Aquificaceae bacterium]MCX8060148.1 sulfur carrier protein ThiS [Aquificaceae bacterium]MDW8097309.1 sulfur carrier protein ThiS [Aquificaceae bacterium]